MQRHHKASPSPGGFSSSLVTSPSLKAQMELLQQSPSLTHRANGALDTDLPTMRRRRGRRKNVEGLELLFLANKRAAAAAAVRAGLRRPHATEGVQLSSPVCPQDEEDTKVPAAEDVQGSHASLAVPEQSRSGGPVEEEEPAASSKELGDWLRQHPGYTMDMAAFTPVGSSQRPLLHGRHPSVAFRHIATMADTHLTDSQ